MSQGARILLGLSMLLLAGCFLAMVPYMKDVSPQAGPGMAICGLFCGVVAVACFSTASQPVTIRIIGGTVFLISALYIVTQLAAFNSVGDELAKAKGAGKRSRPSILNSVGFMILVGLPSGYAAWKGRYPGWGQHASAFGAQPRAVQTVGKGDSDFPVFPIKPPTALDTTGLCRACGERPRLRRGG